MDYDLVLADDQLMLDWWNELDGDLRTEWLRAWEDRDPDERLHLSDACLASLPAGVVRPGAKGPYVAHPVFAAFLDDRLGDGVAG